MTSRLSLAQLRRRTATALSYQDLIGIACRATTPNCAYKAALALGWWEPKARSCRYLAMVARDYGSETLGQLIQDEAPDAFDHTCLCECHFTSTELQGFFENDYYGDEAADGYHTGEEDWDEQSDDGEEEECDCCDDNECFDAWHTFEDGDACPNCVRDWTEEDRTEKDDSQWNDAHQDETADEDGQGLEAGDNHDRDNHAGSKDGAARDAEYKEKERCRFPEPTNRVERIAYRLQRVTGTNYPVKIVSSADPNGFAYGDSIVVTTAADTVLDDDEMAWLIGHELAHNLARHPSETYARDASLREGVIDTISSPHGNLFLNLMVGGVLGLVEHAANRFQDRSQELLADIEGQAIMHRAGYDPGKAASAQCKLNAGRPGGGVFGTHPTYQQRIRTLGGK